MNCADQNPNRMIPRTAYRMVAEELSKSRAEVERLRADLKASKSMHEDARLLACTLHTEVERLREALTSDAALDAAEDAVEGEAATFDLSLSPSQVEHIAQAAIRAALAIASSEERER